MEPALCISALGATSSVSATQFDLRNELLVGQILRRSTGVGSSSGLNVTYCLPGPTGHRLAARFAITVLTISLIECVNTWNSEPCHISWSYKQFRILFRYLLEKPGRRLWLSVICCNQSCCLDSLLQELRRIPAVSTFKQHLKTEQFRLSYAQTVLFFFSVLDSPCSVFFKVQLCNYFTNLLIPFYIILLLSISVHSLYEVLC